MFKVIDSLLFELRPSFSREASFAWFVIIVVGLIVRFDHYGATSFIRWLFLDPQCYGLMLRFFRTSSWSVRVLMERWTEAVISRYPVVEMGAGYLRSVIRSKWVKRLRRCPVSKNLLARIRGGIWLDSLPASFHDGYRSGQIRAS